jgi:hypothetical protein
MTIATVTVCDAIHANTGHLPAGLAAGYTTGTGIVPWTAEDWKAHPGAVRICQDPGATDTTADILDVEAGAATLSDVTQWARGAAVNYAAAKRPGQRRPAVYMSLSAVTPVVNALIAGGITAGVSLWIANWNLTAAEATALVHLGGGPFPVIGVQYRNAGLYDVSEFSAPWLGAVSGAPAPPAPARPVLQQGMTGPAVRTLQQALNRHGYHLTVDGVFGLATRAAVRSFQVQHGLAADSIVGQLTWAKLT